MSAQNRYARERRQAIAAGTWEPRTPTGPVLEHLERLRAAGMYSRRVAAAAGVSERTLRGLKSRSRVQAATAQAILAVQPDTTPAAPAGFVAVLGAARRLQALTALGWTLKEQARLLHLDHRQVWDIAHQRYPLVKVSTWQRVAVLFERLSATPGGSAVAARTASVNGWVPPLAWDCIDDPDAVPDLGGVDVEPDPVAVDRALAGEQLRLTRQEKAAALRRGVERGMSLSRTALRLGISHSTARALVSCGDQSRPEAHQPEGETVCVA